MRGIVFSTLAKMLIVLLVIISVLILWNIIYGKSTERFRSIGSSANVSVVVNATKCNELLLANNCEEYNRLGCEKILGVKCEG